MPENFILYKNSSTIYGFPYINLLTNQINYYNLHFLTGLFGTTGFAAGNSLEEALVQGASEIYERIALNLFYKN